MKKFCFLLLLTILCSSISFAQSLKSISILGDSYSTFEGYLQPDTNSIWYYVSPRQQTDVTSVKQTWWHKFIKENNYRLCVNNSFSGATICNTGYRNEDYSDRSFITRMDQLGCPDVIFVLAQLMIVGLALRLGSISMWDGLKTICINSVRLWLICSIT